MELEDMIKLIKKRLFEAILTRMDRTYFLFLSKLNLKWTNEKNRNIYSTNYQYNTI